MLRPPNLSAYRHEPGLGRLGPMPDFDRYPEAEEAAYYAMVAGGGPNRDQMAIAAAREAAGLPIEETRAEAKTRLIKHLSALIGSTSVGVGGDPGGDSGAISFDELESDPGYDGWADAVREAGFTPNAIIAARQGNIQTYHAHTVRKHARTFFKVAAAAATAGAAAVAMGAGGAAGAAGGASAGGGAGAGASAGSAAALKPIAVTAAKLPVAGGAGVILPSAATAGATALQTMPAASAILEASGPAIAGSAASKALPLAKKVVGGVNKARAVAAIADGEVPPPPLSLEGDTFRDWAVSVGKGQLEKELRERQIELAEDEQRAAEAEIEREIARLQRRATQILEQRGESPELGTNPSMLPAYEAGDVARDAQSQRWLAWGVAAAALGIVGAALMRAR